MLMPAPGGPDASGPGTDPMADAGVPDALVIDGPPPWEPPAPVLPDDPCVIVSNEPEVMYDAGMANYSVRFRDGQGLEASGDLRQSGLLEVEQADLNNRDAIEKRLGADILGDTRTGGTSIPDADKQALWARYDEVVLQTNQRIYSRKQVTNEAAFQWRDVGSWVQTKLREQYANAFDVAVFNADSVRIGEATAVAYELQGNDVFFAVYGPTMTREAVQTLTTGGSRPRLSALGDTSVMLTYNFSGGPDLRALRWNVGNDLPVGVLTVPIAGVVNDVWDVHGAVLDDVGDEVTAWVAQSPLSTMEITIRINAVTGATALAAPAAIQDVAVAVWPRRVAGADVRIATAMTYQVAGLYRVQVTFFDFNATTGALSAAVGGNVVLADSANPPIAVALSYLDRDNVYAAVEQSGDVGDNFRKVSYYTADIGGTITSLGIVHNYTSLASQGAIVAGTPSDTLVSAGAEPLISGFVEQLQPTGAPDSDTNRNGWVMYAPHTGEVLARSFVGYTGNKDTRSARRAKGSLVVTDPYISWGGAVSILSEPGGTNGPITVSGDLNAIAACFLDRTAVANDPAVADGTTISAHAGYPRAYDGTNEPFEFDWHTLPRLLTIGGAVAGQITAGDHFVALTWESDDANGIRYRSPPHFFANVLTSAGGAVSARPVTWEPLTHTEREDVRAVIWMTTAAGGTFYRAEEIAVPGATTLTIDVLDATLLASEVLDQGGVPATQGLIPGERARVTDFVARAGDRLHSRDPLQGKIHRFSIPSREASGFSMHWPLAFAVEEPDERDVTGVLEMDGRIVIGSELGLALLTADGPDATGAGSFGQPTILRAEIGIEDQPQIARTPIGYAFGTRNGEPKLLTPGLTVEDLAKQVERAYKIDGTNIVSIAYDQNREEMLFLANAGKTLRLNTSTGRWGSDPTRLGRDLTVTKDGTLYLIRSDGKVLRQREDVWADGGVGYALKVSTPWIRDMARDATTHSSFRLGAVYVSGEYLGPHDLFFDVYKDFGTTPWGTFQIPEATIVANSVNPASPGWVYGVRLGGMDSFLAVRIAVRDGAEPNRTFRLAQMDIDILPNKSSQYAELPTTHYAAKV